MTEFPASVRPYRLESPCEAVASCGGVLSLPEAGAELVPGGRVPVVQLGGAAQQLLRLGRVVRLHVTSPAQQVQVLHTICLLC